MNEELISIIIPIYNVEKYLSQCVNSIINHIDYGRGTVTDVFHKMDDKNKFTVTFDKNPYAPQTFYYDAIKRGKFSLVVRK